MVNTESSRDVNMNEFELFFNEDKNDWFVRFSDKNLLHNTSVSVQFLINPNELMEIMKYELTNEINREIINDLRTMAGIANTIDYASINNNNTSGNNEDQKMFWNGEIYQAMLQWLKINHPELMI